MSDAAAKVMLITGGTGSIGGELARQAVAAGWRVAVHGRSPGSVRTMLDLLGAADEVVSGHPADFSWEGAIEDLVDQAVERWGGLDAVVDCAAHGPEGVTGPFLDTDPGAYVEWACRSVVAFQRLAHAALPTLIDRRGSLVALVSDSGLFSAAGQSMIGAMRAAAIGFVRNLAVEVARDGVRVNAVSPSFVEGTRTVGRLHAEAAPRLQSARRRAGLGLPAAEDVGALVLFLCGPGSRRLTGQVISLNGGLNA